MTNKLIIGGGVVALLCAAAFSGLGFTINADNKVWGISETYLLGGLGLLALAAAGAVTWSAWQKGRMWWLGLGLGLAHLGVTVSPPLIAGLIQTHGLLALFIIYLGFANLMLALINRNSQARDRSP